MFVHDEDTYRKFYGDLSAAMKEEFGLDTDHQMYHTTASANNFIRKIRLNPDVNNIVLRVEWDKLLWDPRRIAIAKAMAGVISSDLAGVPMPDNGKMLRRKDIGFDGYDL